MQMHHPCLCLQQHVLCCALPCRAVCHAVRMLPPVNIQQVGAAFMSHNVALPDGQSLKFEIWDTAGQVRPCAHLRRRV